MKSRFKFCNERSIAAPYKVKMTSWLHLLQPTFEKRRNRAGRCFVSRRSVQSPSADGATALTVLMKGWWISSTVKANTQTHQRGCWSAQRACSLQTWSRSRRVSGWTWGLVSDAAVFHGRALDYGPSCLPRLEVHTEQTLAAVDFGLRRFQWHDIFCSICDRDS